MCPVPPSTSTVVTPPPPLLPMKAVDALRGGRGARWTPSDERRRHAAVVDTSAFIIVRRQGPRPRRGVQVLYCAPLAGARRQE
eukprot:COSAG01_NODE_1003_length_12216_cov_8.565350_4_plen_83_part_00